MESVVAEILDTVHRHRLKIYVSEAAPASIFRQSEKNGEPIQVEKSERLVSIPADNWDLRSFSPLPFPNENGGRYSPWNVVSF
jgi:hypothetical protein